MTSAELVRAHRVRVGTFIRYAVAISILAGTALALALWWYPLTTSPPYMWFIWMVDFDVYRMGGSAVVNGLPLYDLKAPAGPFPDVLPFTYTPFSALLFVPLSVLDAGLVHTLWTVANVLAIGVAVWLALGMMGVTEPRRRLVLTLGGAAVAHLLDPVLANLLSGQINTLIMVLVLVSFASTQPKRWRGVPLGLAAGIKLTPLIFIVYLWLIGRRRTAVEAGAGFLATVAVGFVLLPGEAWRYWFGGVFHAADRVLISPIPVNNSLSGLFARLSGQLAAPAWALAISALVGVLGLLAARRAARLGHGLLGVVVVGFTAVLVSPVSWPAHAVWIVPALVWLPCVAWRNRSVRLGVVLAVVAAWFTAPVYLLAQRLDGDTPYSYTPAGNLIATFGSTLPVIVVALATLPVWLPRLRAPTGDQRISGDVPRIGWARPYKQGESMGSARVRAVVSHDQGEDYDRHR